MKILISGAEGFIGRHAAAAFKDHDVTGFDIKSGVDARDYFRTANDYYDVMIHAAAVIGGRTTIDGAPLDVAVDLAIDAEMFQWAARTRPGKLVLFSSSAAYPVRLQRRSINGQIHRLIESDILDLDPEEPDGIYGWVKLTLENVARFAELYNLNIFIARPFSGYGSDQDLDYPFPAFIQKAISREDVFPIWGDKSSCRDWIHVDDICNALKIVVEDDIQGTYNLCTGVATRFDDLAKMMCRHLGYEPVIVEQSNKPMGVHTRVGNPKRMNSFYSADISIEEGVIRALADSNKEHTWP